MRLIDADELKEMFEKGCITECDCCSHKKDGSCGLIDNAPTVEERPKGEWIPVSEILPDKGGTYLLWGKLADNEDCYCFIGDYDEGCEQFGYWEQQYDPNTLGCLGEDFFKYECVIAWMPLPKPYVRGDV